MPKRDDGHAERCAGSRLCLAVSLARSHSAAALFVLRGHGAPREAAQKPSSLLFLPDEPGPVATRIKVTQLGGRLVAVALRGAPSRAGLHCPCGSRS